ncbi:MAG: HindIII family type II restriction endonuclease [Bacteroides sp.]|nr:HindIII family type II restriction endonuclease [Bacteroides sp.]
MSQIISDIAINRRKYWTEEIRKLSGNFINDTERLEKELLLEVGSNTNTLIDHLRLCGNIPESYGHDTSEEKLYSKYTDILLSLAFKQLGFKSLVLKERADAADVEIFGNNYCFVADAKAFRLSRTAKNTKDFKVAAMHNWKRGKPYAMVVCPIYQLPTTSSQIYFQATSHNVCIFTYSHLALLLSYSEIKDKTDMQELIQNIFDIIPALNPSKSAVDYWLAINRTILSFSEKIKPLWDIEKGVATESINIAKEEALTFLANERHKIVNMNHQEAINELIKVHKIDSKIKIINKICDNKLFTLK